MRKLTASLLILATMVVSFVSTKHLDNIAGVMFGLAPAYVAYVCWPALISPKSVAVAMVTCYLTVTLATLLL